MVDMQLLVRFPLFPQPHSEGEAEAAVGSQALCVIFIQQSLQWGSRVAGHGA